jgi:hypothetical protein
LDACYSPEKEKDKSYYVIVFEHFTTLFGLKSVSLSNITRREIMRSYVVIFNRVFLILLVLAMPLILVCNRSIESSPEDAVSVLMNYKSLEFIDTVPLRFDTYHVQGLEITKQFYFVTSVDTEHRRGWLFKVDRQNTGLISKKELTNAAFIHPGGIQFDGRYLWVPNAEYKRESRTIIYGIDPDSLTIRKSFSVEDHIGAVASDGKNHLYGVNWDALCFYTWDLNGYQTNKVDSPTSIAYQDIKYFEGKLLCSGHKGGDSVIDIIDPESWTLVKRINLPADGWRKTLSREGMAFDGNLYFLPDDGLESNIMIFRLTPLE